MKNSEKFRPNLSTIFDYILLQTRMTKKTLSVEIESLRMNYPLNDLNLMLISETTASHLHDRFCRWEFPVLPLYIAGRVDRQRMRAPDEY